MLLDIFDQSPEHRLGFGIEGDYYYHLIILGLGLF